MTRITVLGSGTSTGMPIIDCGCSVCMSSDPKNKRTRASILVDSDQGERILVDTTPELRIQAIREAITKVDAVLFTHAHADHVNGLDDLRRFNVGTEGRAIPCFADRDTVETIERSHSYCFNHSRGGAIPLMTLTKIAGPFQVGRTCVTPIPIQHGSRSILGYRIGDAAYLTDCSGIPAESLKLLTGLDVLVLDALRFREHPTHFSLDESVEAAEQIGAKRTFFTHMAHDIDHATVDKLLPTHMALSYDGLQITTS